MVEDKEVDDKNRSFLRLPTFLMRQQLMGTEENKEILAGNFPEEEGCYSQVAFDFV
ncbi:hypothetical protein YC2023_041834 [Brassica napus]